MVAWVAAGQVRPLPKRGIRVTEVTLEVETQVELRTGKVAVVVPAQVALAITRWMAPAHTGVKEPRVVMAVTV
jgi:hypothetical protein